MKLKAYFAIAAAAFLTACVQPETYPISGCDVGTEYPGSCDSVGDNDPVQGAVAPTI